LHHLVTLLKLTHCYRKIEPVLNLYTVHTCHFKSSHVDNLELKGLVDHTSGMSKSIKKIDDADKELNSQLLSM
jgi:hypothetical protein